MRFYQRGQTMAEYLVVASALIGAFFWAANTDCPGYDNCIDKLKTVMHDKYEGYSHSISAVHQYGDYQGEGFESSWGEGNSSSPGDGGDSSGGEVTEQEGLSRSDLVVSPDGNTTYGTISGGQYVVDGDGNIIGSYNSETGEVIIDDVGTFDAVVSAVITDEAGNPVDLQAVVDCSSDEVYGFGYRSGVTGDFHNSLTLEQLDIEGYCLEDTQAVVDKEGNPVNGAVVGENYYANTYTVTIDSSVTQTPVGEVVFFDITVPNEARFSSTDPAIGEQVYDCAVMSAEWDEGAGSDEDKLEVYLTDSDQQVGSVSGSCPLTSKEVTD